MQDADDPTWRRDDSGVSPVVAVIIMVAITITLTAVVYVWTGDLTAIGGGGDSQSGCSQGSGNFLRIESQMPRHVLRERAEYRMIDSNGTVYLGAEADDDHRGTSNVEDEFDWSWSPESHPNIQAGDAIAIDDPAKGWIDGDDLGFSIRDARGLVTQCGFTWSAE